MFNSPCRRTGISITRVETLIIMYHLLLRCIIQFYTMNALCEVCTFECIITKYQIDIGKTTKLKLQKVFMFFVINEQYV